MTAQGEVRNYEEAAMFVVEIDGVEYGAFESCSDYEDVSGVVEQREGGNKKVAAKRDGTQSYTALTLVRGASDDLAMYNWRQEVKDLGARQAERNGSIVALNPDGSARSRINFKRGWPSGYKRSGWDATSDDFTKEEVTIEFHDANFVIET